MNTSFFFVLGLTLAGVSAAQDIYTCVDGRGRTLTADRPIAECIDRPQRELSRNGLVKRQIGPTLTVHEQAAQEEKDKLALEARAREAEEKRRDRALLQRYPVRAAHDQERSAALAQIDEVIKTANKRIGELGEQRHSLTSEMEFYAKNPSRAPAALKHRLEENDNSLRGQKKFIAEQEQEKRRVNQRFDEELARLKQLWVLVGVPLTPAPAASSAKAGKA
ncbi:MAG: DUF4124 domain-containing protein [Polaromonas sp.]